MNEAKNAAILPRMLAPTPINVPQVGKTKTMMMKAMIQGLAFEPNRATAAWLTISSGGRTSAPQYLQTTVLPSPEYSLGAPQLGQLNFWDILSPLALGRILLFFYSLVISLFSYVNKF